MNLTLSSDGKNIINKEKIECEFVNEILKYQDDKDTLNTIDLKEDIFIRENNEFMFKIDFKNQWFYYKLKENNIEINKAPLKASISKENIITLKYNLGEEEKLIIIHLL